MQPKVQVWFDELTGAQRAVLRQLRGLIMAAHPDIHEQLKWNQPCYLLKGPFCYLQKAKTHVSLGFQRGVFLKDPRSLLVGDGKEMRHVKLSLDDPKVTRAHAELITDAIEYNLSR